MRPRRAQSGVAVIVAVLVVALATSVATYLLWQQSLWTRQIENLGARAQGDALARGAAVWAAAILAEDDPAIDHLGELWARGMPAFAAEAAQFAGAITDEQSKFNVNNLAREGGVAPQDLVAFQRLLAAVGLPAGLAEAVVDWLDPDDEVMAPNGAEDPYYLALDPPYRAANHRVIDIAELARVKGFDAGIVARLAPFVTALPEETPVNVNTAPAQVLQALVPGISAEDARRLVELRAKRPFASRDDFLKALPQRPSAPIDAQIDIKSQYFVAEATVRLGRVVAGYHALLRRSERGLPAAISLSQVAI
ncbi:MAG TPA: type II secretion system minor pseudopilin GspK [Burkholderiales bacterium]|nr:type II secretion system minor pseudopilin GspK [Burkholderiales bacterium]